MPMENFSADYSAYVGDACHT